MTPAELALFELVEILAQPHGWVGIRNSQGRRIVDTPEWRRAYSEAMRVVDKSLVLPSHPAQG